MKQFYYGNVYEEGGYKILAKSDAIPDSAVREMEKLATMLGSASEKRIFGMAKTGQDTIFFSVTAAAPRAGENRGTYFSHQLFITADEMKSFHDFPRFLLQADKFFMGGYADSYDTRDVSVSKFSGGAYVGELAEPLKSAVDKKKLILHSERGDVSRAMSTMAQICGASGVDAQNRLTFVTAVGGSSDKGFLDRFFYIFCGEREFETLKSKYNKSCFYYDCDNGSLIDTDKPTLRTNAPKVDTGAEPHLQITIEPSAKDKEKKRLSDVALRVLCVILSALCVALSVTAVGEALYISKLKSASDNDSQNHTTAAETPEEATQQDSGSAQPDNREQAGKGLPEKDTESNARSDDQTKTMEDDDFLERSSQASKNTFYRHCCLPFNHNGNIYRCANILA